MASSFLSIVAIVLLAPEWWSVRGYLPQENPARGQYYLDLGANRQELRDFEGAIGDYTTALEYNPTSREAFIARATAYCEMQREREASSDFRRAGSLDGVSGPETCRDWRANYKRSPILRMNRILSPGR